MPLKSSITLCLSLSALALVACATVASTVDPAFNALPTETLKATRWDSGDTTISNEARLDLFRPALEKARGGVYVGVGGLQNFTMAAWARSEHVFLMDFTRTVVVVNRVQVALLKSAATGEEFRDMWLSKGGTGTESALAAIGAHMPPEEVERARRLFKQARPFVVRYITRMDRVRKAYKYSTFYDAPEDYAYMRGLALKNRIRPVEGNLLGTITLRGIGTGAAKAGVPVRVLYLSNAEEYFPFRPYPADFIQNVTSLKGDETSVVIRTVSLNQGRWPWAPGSRFLTTRGFHYGVQSLAHMQEWLGGPKTSVLEMFKVGQRGEPAGLTRLGAPGL